MFARGGSKSEILLFANVSSDYFSLFHIFKKPFHSLCRNYRRLNVLARQVDKNLIGASPWTEKKVSSLRDTARRSRVMLSPVGEASWSVSSRKSRDPRVVPLRHEEPETSAYLRAVVV